MSSGKLTSRERRALIALVSIGLVILIILAINKKTYESSVKSSELNDSIIKMELPEQINNTDSILLKQKTGKRPKKTSTKKGQKTIVPNPNKPSVNVESKSSPLDFPVPTSR